MISMSYEQQKSSRASANDLWRILVPDKKSPKMDRVRRPDGSLTDMVNLTHACDAAQSLAIHDQQAASIPLKLAA
jgi:hypothetical protein